MCLGLLWVAAVSGNRFRLIVWHGGDSWGPTDLGLETGLGRSLRMAMGRHNSIALAGSMSRRGKL